jgi:hypothetical protein
VAGDSPGHVAVIGAPGGGRPRGPIVVAWSRRSSTAWTRPGALGATTRKVADAGVNIELAYLATNTRLVLAAADVDKVKTAI